MRKRGRGRAADVFASSTVIVGLIIGAGFASGQELMSFFAKYRVLGFAGVLLSGMLMYFISRIVMEACISKKLGGYEDFVRLVFGKTAGRFINLLVFAFTAVLFCAMFAGTGAIFKQSFNLSFTFGTIVMGVICFVTFLFDLDGIAQMNSVLVPFMVLCFVFLGVYSEMAALVPVFLQLNAVMQNFAFSALVYSSYNLITAIPMMAQLGANIADKKTAKTAAAAAASVLTLVSIIFLFPMISRYDALKFLEIPMLALAKEHGRLAEYIFVFVMLCSIYTTAIADGFIAIEWLDKRVALPKTLTKLLVTICGVILAHVGFSALVGRIYPVFGVLGILEIAGIAWFFATEKRKSGQKNGYGAKRS